MTMDKAVIISTFICLLTFSLAGVFSAERISRYLSERSSIGISSRSVAFTVLLASFLGMVSLGLSGSSLRVFLEDRVFIHHDTIGLFGKSRGIRSDECAVLTPMAIGQYNDDPQFPVINKNLGPQGQNMLVVAFSGVPVKHLSLLAKPATWGFFFLDLRHALAWYWWFPVFGCLLALWGLLNLVYPDRWRLMLALSAAFTFAPYVVAWSFWPAYTVFFPAFAMSIVLLSFRYTNYSVLLILSLMLGVSVAGFFLVLYPPWQVSTGYLFLFFFIGVVIRDRLYEQFTLRHGLMVAIAGLTAGVILYSWWLDARFAITAMMNTVYPGQRAMVTGGGIDFFFPVRGLSNVVTLHKSFGYLNECEMASFIYVTIPLLFTVFERFRVTRRADPVACTLILFVFLLSIYQYIGISPAIAKLSLLGRCTGSRVDIALGLAQIFLIGFVLTDRNQFTAEQQQLFSRRIFHLMIPVLWAGFLLYSFWRLTFCFTGFNGNVRFFAWILVSLFIGLTALASYYLMRGKSRPFIIVYCLMTMAISLPFNPLIRVPGTFELKNCDLLKNTNRRVLALDSHSQQAMMFMATGLPVVNGVHYYPQRSLWDYLDPYHAKDSFYNRYAHVCFASGHMSGDETFRIENPSPDVVVVVVDGSRFDFRTIPADFLVTNEANSSIYDKNSTLSLRLVNNGWRVYQVNR